MARHTTIPTKSVEDKIMLWLDHVTESYTLVCVSYLNNILPLSFVQVTSKVAVLFITVQYNVTISANGEPAV